MSVVAPSRGGPGSTSSWHAGSHPAYVEVISCHNASPTMGMLGHADLLIWLAGKLSSVPSKLRAFRVQLRQAPLPPAIYPSV